MSLKKRWLSVILTCVLLIGIFPVVALADVSDYDAAAVSKINTMITTNGLTGYQENDPESWDFAEWDTSGTPYQLMRLELFDMKLTGSLVLSNISSLKYLDCGFNQLTSLDVNNNLLLEELRCGSNPLTSLDVSGNTELKYLQCVENQLTSLDVTGNTELLTLECDFNQLTSLDVSNNLLLEGLYCGSNQLTSLDVSGNTELKYLRCVSNRLTSLDVTGNTELLGLGCDSNQLTSLDISNNLLLEELRCGSNPLTSLDLTDNTALIYLECGANELTSLDVTKNVALKRLDCFSNQLKSLDLTNNTALIYLNCAENRLTSLDVSNNPALQELICDNNYMTSIADVIGYDSTVTTSLTFSPQVVDYYKDVDTSQWYKNAVVYSMANDLFVGTSDTTWEPDTAMTRAMFVTVLGKYDGVDVSAYPTCEFKDIPDGQWYTAYTQWAYEQELVVGTGNGSFSPNDPITRQEMAVIFYKYVESKGTVMTPVSDRAFKAFPDHGEANSWAVTALTWATGKGIMNGDDQDKLLPLGTATRAEGAQVFMAIIERILK